MKKTVLIFFLTLFISCKSIDNKNPNIVLFFVDDLGWTDLSFMGSKYYETPHIDNLSKSGMTFYNGYASAANCTPSRATMFTGKYSTSHGIYTVADNQDLVGSERGNDKTRKLIPIKNKRNLDLEYVLIPEMLKDKGYLNAHFGKWHLGNEGFYPEDQGFDFNFGGNQTGGPKGGYFSPYKNPNISDGPKGEYLTDRIGNEVVNFIDTNQNQTFFAYVPFYSVHTPIQSKKDLQKKYSLKDQNENHNRADYAGMIQSVDENIGKIINKIEDLGLSENTLFIFTSDNGGIRSISKQSPLRAGKGSYYEGGIKVPLIFSWRGKIKEASKSYERVSNIDFFPTIKKIVGYKNNDLKLDGVDLSPLFEGRNLKKRALFYHFPIYLQAYNVQEDNGTDPLFRTRPGSVIIKDKWKLHHYFEDDKKELYDIENDISESYDLSKVNIQKTEELFNSLNSWRELNNAPIPFEKNIKYNQKFVDSINSLIIDGNLSGRINTKW